MAVEPRDRGRDAGEDHPVGDELVNLVDVEPVIGRPVQAAERAASRSATGCRSRRYIHVASAMAAAATQRLTPATLRSIWMV